MRNNISRFLLVLLVLTVCFNPTFAERVSQEDAALVATNFMTAGSTSSSARKSVGKRLVLKSTTAAEENPQYYVYEYQDGGWVIVAANDAAHPILAYSKTGSFRTDKQPKNVQNWMEGRARQIKYAEENNLQATEEVSAEWKQLRKAPPVTAQGNVVVAPLIKTTWDQDDPYWKYCPSVGSTKTYTGCVATAMAQVMNYWQWPEKGTGSYSYTSETNSLSCSADFANTTYDWGNMVDHYTKYYSGASQISVSTPTNTQKDAVAVLMYHCGVAVKMDYGTSSQGGSSAFTIYPNKSYTTTRCAAYALINNFGYNSSTLKCYYREGGYGYSSVSDAVWLSLLKTELDENRPIMYAGADSEGGHSFICDGYDDQDFFHFNWGWSGYCDGYYTVDDMVPGTGGSGAGNGSYNDDQDIIIGIQPPVTGHKIVTNGTGCTITPSVARVENGNSVTATITPTDATYDYTSITVKLGTTTLTSGTHYTLSADKKTLTINASAITGSTDNDLTITVVWTKNRYSYSLLGTNCTEELEGMLNKNAALNLTITPNTGYTLADAACWMVEMGSAMLTYGTDFTYNASTNTFSIVSVTGDVTILAEAGRQVTWIANGSTHATNLAVDDKITLPSTNPADCSGSGGKKFVGWCTNSSYSHATTAPTFAKTGDAYSVATYYAVYATAGSGGGSSATYEFSITASDFSGSSYAANNGEHTSTAVDVDDNTNTLDVTWTSNQVYQNGDMQWQKSNGYIYNNTDLGKINSVTVSTVSGSFTTYYGTSEEPTNTTLGTSDGYFKVVTGTSSAGHTNSITVNFTQSSGGGTSYSDYSTTCAACTLTGITLNTSGATTTFTQGQTFTSEGLVVTASYSDCSDRTVSPTSVSSPDMSSTGNKTVTVTYTEGEVTKTKTYTITVNAAPTYTIRFFDGTTKLKEESLVADATATPPSDPEDCDAYDFVGWYTSKLADDNTTVTSGWITDFTVSTAQDYYAVYSHTETSGSGGEASLTKQGSSSSFSAGDNIVIVAKSTSYALYQETVSTSYVKNWSFENSATTVGADAKNYLTLSAGTTTGKWYLGDATNGYLYNTSSGNELYVKTDGTKNEWTITWNSTQSAFTIVGGRNLACRTDLTGSNANKYRSANGTSNGIAYFDIYKYVAGGGSSTTYYTGTKDCTLPTSVTVTFNANGGEGTMADQTIPYNEATALNANTFSREGYTFQGWATSASGEKVHNDQASVSLTKNTDLYAVWQKNSHNVSYTITPADKATATINSSATTPQSIDYGESVTLDITPDAAYIVSEVTATGVTLSGTGNSRTFTMPDNDVAITITMVAKPKYTVTWSANGTTTTDEYIEGASIVFPATATGCDGKVFVGWSAVTVDETDTKPALVTSATMGTSPLTYYAVFAESSTGSSTNKFKRITTDAELERAVGTQIVIISNNASKILQNDFTSVDAPTPDGDGLITVTDDQIWTLTEKDSYDYWKLMSGTVQLGVNTTSGYSSGYQVCGNYSTDASWWYITHADNVSGTADCFYLYNWSNGTWYDLLEYYGGTTQKWESVYFASSSATGFATYGATQIYIPATTYSGYTTSCIPPTEVTVSFDANGGTGTMADQTIAYNTAETLNANSFTREGYTFQGWATSATGEKVYNDGGEVTLKKNTTLYAVWSINSHNVSYVITPAGKATVTINSSATTPQTIEYGQTVTIDITPDGEYTISDVTATGVTSSGTGTQRTFIMPDDDVVVTITLAAKPKYTVTWSAAGTITTEQYIEGATITFPTTAASCGDKAFVGWSTAEIPEPTDTKPTTFVTSAKMGTSSLTYYAVYATEGEGTGTATWEEAEITTLTSSDVFVIVGNGAYALPNDASSTPPVSSVTVSEGKITSTVGNTLTWNISGNGTDGYTFYPNGSTTKWLFSNTNAESSSNTNIRVGTGEGSTVVRKVWKLDTNNQLVTKDTYTPRYLAVQGNSDWRGYVNSSTSKTTITFYKQTGGGKSYTGYTTACGANISAKNVGWITATKGQKVKRVINVSAAGFDEAATLSATSSNSHFTVSLAETAVPGDKSSLATTLTVEYNPAEYNVKETDATITLTAGSITKEITVSGRSLPEEFLLITKKSDTWYALPANMTGGPGEYDGVQVVPNNLTTPTKVDVSPSTIIYTLASDAATRYATNGDCVRLVGNNSLCLWSNLASGTGQTNIQNKTSVATAATDNHEWLLTTTDGVQYTIYNPNHPDYPTRRLGYGAKFGLYAESSSTSTIFYIVESGCTTQPGNVTVSARRADATFSWESNASSVQINLYSDKNLTTQVQSVTATSQPYVLTGLQDTTKYWFKLIPTGDEACYVIDSFKTIGPQIDITEWKEDAVVIFVDKDENLDPVIVIDGQEEHGSITGGGGSATELFFSKYFEGSGDMKLVAIFNGTGHDIDLSDYKLYTKNCSAPSTEAAIASSTFGGTTEYPISALGTIKAGHEIVFFTRPLTTGTQANLSACSVEYLNEVATHKEVTDNPRWIECDNSTYYGEKKFPLMQFNGNDAIYLEKNDNLIDVIGATGDPGKVKNCANRLNDLGWSIRVKNMDYGKSVTDEAFDYLYEASSKTPSNDTERKAILEGFGINLDDEYIDLTTARCILFRDKRVVSGDSAVTMNSGAQFVTCTSHTEGGTPYLPEWNGRAVCMDNDHQAAAGVTDDSKATCNSYQDLGAFNFTDYYIDWTSISPGTTLDSYTHDDETHLYTIPITNLSNYACLNIRFQLKKEGAVLTETSQQVPIIIAGNKNTNDPLFSELVIDKVDENDPSTWTPDYLLSVERCRTCDVVVLGSGALTKVDDSDSKDVPRVQNIKVYPGGQLIVPENTHYTANSLALRRQEDDVASAKIEGTLNVLTDDATYLDIRIDPTNWHYFTLPYDCNVSDIRFANEGETAIPQVGSDFLLCSYDGEHRAATKSTSWKDLTSTDVLKKGIGYIIAIPGDGKVQREFRFPMANTVLTEENDDKLIGDLHAWGGNDAELRPNHKGWNLIGNPYMMYYNLPTTTTPLAAGTLIHDPDEDPWLGHWVIKDGTGDDAATPLYYIVVPQDNGWSEYKQTTIGGFDMPPFTSYFVQLGGNPDENKGIEFVTTNKEDGPSPVIRRAPAEDIVDNHEVWFGVDLINTDGESDETTLLMSDKFTNNYDMMRDLVKIRGTYYTYYTKPVLASRNNEGEMAFNALPDSTAAAGVPLNFFAAADGQYRFTVSAHYPLDEVKEAYIYDNDNADAKWHNLLQEDYVFNAKRGDNTSRFLLAVKVERKQPEITTSIDNLHKGLVLTTINRTLMLSGLTNDADIYVYDVSGKLLDARLHYSSESGIFRTTVNTAGLYFVRVKTPDGQQTLETVVY